jgi:hypothetical protein
MAIKKDVKKEATKKPETEQKVNRRGAPPKKDRGDVKDQRFDFVFSKNKVAEFGERSDLIKFVKSAVDKYKKPKPKPQKES